MNTSKIYHDSEGNECTIFQAVRREPEWAAVRIQEGEKAIDELKCIKSSNNKSPCKEAKAFKIEIRALKSELKSALKKYDAFIAAGC